MTEPTPPTCTCKREIASMETNVDRLDIPTSAYVEIRRRCPVHGEPTPPADCFDVIPDAGDGEPSIVMRDAPTDLREQATDAAANALGKPLPTGITYEDVEAQADAVLAVMRERIEALPPADIPGYGRKRVYLDDVRALFPDK